MMRNCLYWILTICVIFLLPSGTLAQVPTHIVYDWSGTGNFLVSPVYYSGSIDAGEPMLVGGTWDLSIDDTGWPPDTDKLVRWNYIDATYFAPFYDPYQLSWTGTFDNHTTASDLLWNASSSYGGLHGTAVLQITILDFDGDEVIDTEERAFSVFSGTLVVVKDGTGIWAGYCGLGSFSGSSSNPDPGNWADDVVGGSTILDIENCSVPATNVTWGQIKQKYE
jgi:hypothetical protein